MVAHLVRLKLTLVRNGLRRSAWQVVGLVVGALYGLLALVVAVAGLVTASVSQPDALPLVTVLLGSALVLGWCVVPLVAFGVDGTVDPQRFVLFPVPRRTLVVGLALGALIGIPGVITTLVAVTTGLVWWRDPVALVAGVIGAVLGLATCVVGSRATTTALSALVAHRRFREVLAALAIVPFLLIGPVLSQVSSVTLSRETFDRVADVLGWTPLGAAWAVPVAVEGGEWLGALGRLAVAAATVLLLAWAWLRALAHASVNPPHERTSSKQRGLGWFGRFPATPLGAVAARCLTYWVRDPRYAMSLAFIPLIAVVLWFTSGGGSTLLLIGPVTAFFLGWGISADVSYDGTAFWTHVASPLRGATDRAGRIIAVSTFGVPLALALAVVSVLVVGENAALPAVLGATIGTLLTALGAASVASALVVTPVQKVGESPFQTRQGQSTAAFVSQMVGWLAVFGLTLPETVLAWVAVTTGSAALAWVALLVGVVLGVTFLVLGVRIGGRTLERMQPALLTRMLSFT